MEPNIDGTVEHLSINRDEVVRTVPPLGDPWLMAASTRHFEDSIDGDGAHAEVVGDLTIDERIVVSARLQSVSSAAGAADVSFQLAGRFCHTAQGASAWRFDASCDAEVTLTNGQGSASVGRSMTRLCILTRAQRSGREFVQRQASGSTIAQVGADGWACAEMGAGFFAAGEWDDSLGTGTAMVQGTIVITATPL